MFWIRHPGSGDAVAALAFKKTIPFAGDKSQQRQDENQEYLAVLRIETGAAG